MQDGAVVHGPRVTVKGHQTCNQMMLGSVKCNGLKIVVYGLTINVNPKYFTRASEQVIGVRAHKSAVRKVLSVQRLGEYNVLPC